QFYMFEDGLFVRKAYPEYRAINGGKVISIDGVPAKEVFDRVSQIVWHDNDQGIKDIGPWLLSSPQVLHALRIAKSLDKIEIRVLKDGKEVSAELKPTAKAADLRNASEVMADSRPDTSPKPL